MREQNSKNTGPCMGTRHGFAVLVVAVLLGSWFSYFVYESGGNADVDSRVDAARRLVTESFLARVDRVLKDVETDLCKEKIVQSLESYLISEIEEHGPWTPPDTNLQVAHTFKSQCGERLQKKTRVRKRPRNASDVSIFYFIMAHSKSASLIRLIETLYHSNHAFYVHFDAKTNASVVRTFERLLHERRRAEYLHVPPNPSSPPPPSSSSSSSSSPWSNVFLVSDRVRVHWGGWSMVNATLAGLSRMIGLMNRTIDSRDFDFFINLSETSYPIRSDEVIRRTLATFDPEWNVLGAKPLIGLGGRTHPNALFHYVECDDRLFRVGRLPTPHGIGPVLVGSQWMVLSPPFVRWILAPEQENLRTYFSHHRIPDEVFFHTAIMASPFCHTRVMGDTHSIEWRSNDGGAEKDSCITPHESKCGRSPKILTLADVSFARASKKMFVRKVDVDAGSTELVEKLDLLRAGTLMPLEETRDAPSFCYEVKHRERDCFIPCGRRSGRCKHFCGEHGACCRLGWSSQPEACGGAVGSPERHTCVRDQTLPTCNSTLSPLATPRNSSRLLRNRSKGFIARAASIARKRTHRPIERSFEIALRIAKSRKSATKDRGG